MAEGDEIVHHALLALSAGYALDYQPTGALLNRANAHYRKASDLLTLRLMRPIEIGQEDSVVGALRLMWCDDVSPQLFPLVQLQYLNYTPRLCNGSCVGIKKRPHAGTKQPKQPKK